MKLSCSKTKTTILSFSTKSGISASNAEHPFFALARAKPESFILSIPQLPKTQLSIAVLAAIGTLPITFAVSNRLLNFDDFAKLANPSTLRRINYLRDFFSTHPRVEQPKFVIDDLTNLGNILQYFLVLEEIIEEYQLRRINTSIPEAIEKRRFRALQNAITPWHENYHFTYSQAREVVNLLPYFWNREDSALRALWIKILMTPYSTIASNPWKFRASDILDLIEELESSTIESELKVYGLRHARKLFERANESQKIRTFNATIENEEDEREIALSRLQETNFLDTDSSENIPVRKGVTLSDGTFLALPRMSDFADRVSYFSAMQNYRLRIREDKLSARQKAGEKIVKRTNKSAALAEFLKSLNDEDFF